MNKTDVAEVDLAFALRGTTPIAADHGFWLYAAVSHVLPTVHSPNGIAIHSIRGQQVGERKVQLCDWSRLTIRTATERIGELLPLAGKRLNIAGASVLVGVPQVLGLIPAPALRSRLVTIKLAGDEDAPSRPPERDAFLASVRRKLDALGVSPESEITLGKRRTIRIKQREIVGYELLLSALTAQESLTIQSSPTWSRRHMGCGIFVPVVPRSE